MVLEFVDFLDSGCQLFDIQKWQILHKLFGDFEILIDHIALRCLHDVEEVLEEILLVHSFPPELQLELYQLEALVFAVFCLRDQLVQFREFRVVIVDRDEEKEGEDAGVEDAAPYHLNNVVFLEQNVRDTFWKILESSTHWIENMPILNFHTN